MCICEIGWSGEDCGTIADLCENVDCGENGTCDPENGACICDYGWTGDKCDEFWNLCENVDCGRKWYL